MHISSPKTRSVSFRIPEDLAEALDAEAGMKNIAPSNLLTQILRHHTGFEGAMGKAGLVSFPRPLLKKLMEGFPEKQVVALADYVSKDVMVDMMSILQGEFTVESFLKVIEMWSKASYMPFRRETKGNLNTCVIQHDLNKNWSLYLGQLYKNVIEELSEKRVAIDASSNSLRFRF